MLRQVTYQGVFEPTEGSGFSVYFPDLPGCTSYGKTLREARKNAQDALRLHLCGMEQDGDLIPAPSATPKVDPETAVGSLAYPVTIWESVGFLCYKGYSARPEYSAKDRIFYGKILGISDLVDFQAESTQAIEDEFHKAVDGYLAFCEEMGKEPQRGIFGVKMISFTEFEKNIDQYVEIAQFQDVLIVRNGKAVAKLTGAGPGVKFYVSEIRQSQGWR